MFRVQIDFTRNNFTKTESAGGACVISTIRSLVCRINMELGTEHVQVQSQNVITVVEADDAATLYTISPKRKMLKYS